MVSRITGAVTLLAVCLAPCAVGQDARYINKLRKDAKKGEVTAQYKLGLAYADAYRVKRDYSQAIEWLEKAGAQGHPKAQLFLGRMFYSGVNVAKDDNRAADWFEMGAAAGDAEAQTLIGNLYSNGEGRTKDFGQAAYWYRLGAEQGDARAQYNLGVLYNNGEGLEQNLIEALKWISLAAANPPTEYPKEYGWARDDLAKKLQPEQLTEARKLIESWQGKSWSELREKAEISQIR